MNLWPHCRRTYHSDILLVSNRNKRPLKTSSFKTQLPSYGNSEVWRSCSCTIIIIIRPNMYRIEVPPQPRREHRGVKLIWFGTGQNLIVSQFVPDPQGGGGCNLHKKKRGRAKTFRQETHNPYTNMKQKLTNYSAIWWPRQVTDDTPQMGDGGGEDRLRSASSLTLAGWTSPAAKENTSSAELPRRWSWCSAPTWGLRW